MRTIPLTAVVTLIVILFVSLLENVTWSELHMRYNPHNDLK